MWEQAHETLVGRAMAARDRAIERWTVVVGHGGLSLDDAATRAASVGRLTVNFHPDRVAGDGVTVADGLLNDGRYFNQWRTGISSGSRSAVRGGERDAFEDALFGDVYRNAHPLVDEFPIYGALDLLNAVHGGAPRFGSSYLVLKDHVRVRTTFCLGDSAPGATDVGTSDTMWCILAGLVEQAAAGCLLGRALGIDDLWTVLSGRWPSDPSRSLNGYVEAHIHGGIVLATDVDTLVADPSFRASPVGDALIALAHRYDIGLDWHSGSELAVEHVPFDFRGPRMRELAHHVAGVGGRLTPLHIGIAANATPLSPPSAGGDPADSAAQELKYLWHTLFAYGNDAHAV